MTWNEDTALLDAVERHLRAAPFTREVRRRSDGETVHFDLGLDGAFHSLRVTTPAADSLAPGALVVAPRVNKAMATKIAAASASYVDRAGNMSLRLPPHFIHVEGKRPPSKPAGQMRAPGLRVLLAWLIEPALVGGTLHESCAASNVSVTAVRDMRKRLAELGYVRGTGKARAFTEHGRRRARQMWLEGYRIALRPASDLGGFQVEQAGRDIMKSRALLENTWAHRHRTATAARWTWSGVTAAARVPILKGILEDRGPELHIAVIPGLEVERELPLQPIRPFMVRVRRAPIGLAISSPSVPDWPPDVAHPLMVWTELMCDPDPRAHDAAALLEEKLPPGVL